MALSSPRCHVLVGIVTSITRHRAPNCRRSRLHLRCEMRWPILRGRPRGLLRLYHRRAALSMLGISGDHFRRRPAGVWRFPRPMTRASRRMPVAHAAISRQTSMQAGGERAGQRPVTVDDVMAVGELPLVKAVGPSSCSSFQSSTVTGSQVTSSGPSRRRTARCAARYALRRADGSSTKTCLRRRVAFIGIEVQRKLFERSLR